VLTDLANFELAILGLLIGLMLFFLNRRFRVTNFVESIAILILIMAVSVSPLPFLAEHKNWIYFFLPIYLGSINGWLFFTKRFVFGDDWKTEEINKKGIRNVYLILAFGFIGVLILLITFFSHNYT
jgi:hypothetical protein